MHEARAKNFLIGAAAALVAFAVTQGLRALSPHGSWTNLRFQLFPAPAMDECARLIAIFALLANARVGAFAAGFALCASIAAVAARWPAGDPPALALSLVVTLALQALLSLTGFALAARKTPPFMVFCVLTLIHGAHNGGLIALQAAVNPVEYFAVEIALVALYAAGGVGLARRAQMPAAAKIG